MSCIAIIQTGKNTGQPCGRRPKKGNYCGIHKKNTPQADTKSPEAEGDDDRETQCIICIEPIDKDKDDTITLDCGHPYHRVCFINHFIKSVTGTTCAICRQSIRKVDKGNLASITAISNQYRSECEQKREAAEKECAKKQKELADITNAIEDLISFTRVAEANGRVAEASALTASTEVEELRSEIKRINDRVRSVGINPI